MTARPIVRREHTREEEAAVMRYLKREMKKVERAMDRLFMKELEDMYAGKSERFNRLPEQGRMGCNWRAPSPDSRDIQPVVPNRSAVLIITKKEGKPVITIESCPVPDEDTRLSLIKEKIESGEDSLFNDLGEGGYYEEDLGPGEDIWHRHAARVSSVGGKPVITVVEIVVDHGTKWG